MTINFFKKLFFFLFFIFILPLNIFAFNNNKVGVSLVQPSDKDIENAAKMINANGGDWGYVTLVIQENDRNVKKWQETFDKLRKNHLIPIIRLATVPEGNNWKVPEKESVKNWVEFLGKLNWVVKNRYIVLFNEVNHATEWGGKVDTNSYKEIVVDFSKALKENNKDYFIMMAGFDASAPSQYPKYEDEFVYLREIASKELFENIDGWASHSYPNPGFLGSPSDTGRTSVRGYLSEISFLKNLGIDKELPVFITETGWPHNSTCDGRSVYYCSEDLAAENIKTAYENVWFKDDVVYAVTPFIFKYQSNPFDVFSYVKENDDFYKQYYTVKDLKKNKGNPEQVYNIKIDAQLPQKLIENSIYHFEIDIKNEGQAILDLSDGYTLGLSNKDYKSFFSDFNNFEPFAKEKIDFSFKTNKRVGDEKIALQLLKNDKVVANLYKWDFSVSEAVDLSYQVDLFLNPKNQGNDFEIQVFNSKEELVYRAKNASLEKSNGKIAKIRNVVLGEKYRIVILKPFYLPRQNFITLKSGENQVKFKSMLPFDLNNDGMLSIDDLFSVFK